MGAPPTFDLLLLAVPIASFLLCRRFSPARGPWFGTAGRCLLLFALGLLAARPFLTSQAVGSGEAYNYSLALADGVAQMRAGVMPPLVGQTEYAFNGRVHPLRDAPYLFYLGAGLDWVARHQLTAWELQNLSLAFSLVATFFAAYAALRWGTGCSRIFAFGGAAAYGFSAPLLAAAYSGNLFMTLHAAPFVPLALGACFRAARPPTRHADTVLAAALAAAWLAHPPVAYWLTISAVAVRGLVFWRYPTGRGFLSLVGAIVLWGALAGFVVASVATMSGTGATFDPTSQFGTGLLPILRSAFPGCLLPVPRPSAPTSVADFQLGYLGWVALAALIALIARRPAWIARKPRLYCAVLAAVGAAVLQLILTLPVPGLTAWLWNHAPDSAVSLTNIWPMQRLYLTAGALVLFAAGLIQARLAEIGFRWGRWAWALAALGAGWTAWQAGSFLVRGQATRWSAADSARSFLPSNIDLTVTAYAFLQTPETFIHGVMDPALEFRLMRNDEVEIDSSYAAALRTGAIVAQGSLRVLKPAAPSPAIEVGTVTLRPGRRYLLEFQFHTPPMPGEIELFGPSLSRSYTLPSAGNPAGFGMTPGSRRAVSVWTSQDTPEEVAIRVSPQWPAGMAKPPVFADYVLYEVDPAQLPARLESLLPLRFAADAPQVGEFVEVPRRWLPGYVATVSGRSLTPLRSPDHAVMIPVPRGRSEVELDYPGPWIVRAAFWLAAASWLGFFAFSGAVAAGVPRPRFALRRLRRPLLVGGGVLVAAAAAAAWWFARGDQLALGPIRVTFYLPFDRTGHVEPIVVTGRTGAGTTVYIRYPDPEHIRIGADIWGGAWESDPIPTNYFRQQNLVIDSSGFYPLDQAAFAALPPGEKTRLRGEFRAELNGRVVLDLQRSAYDSTPAEVVIGRNAIGSSVAEAQFSGQVLRAKRLPIPRWLVLAGDRQLRLKVRLPAGHAGVTEPVLALGPAGRDGLCAVTYLEDGTARFSLRAADGRVLAASDRAFDRSSAHELVFSLGRPATPAGAPSVAVQADGQPLVGEMGQAALERPEVARVGLDPAAPAGIDCRFTGAELSVEEPAAGRQEGAGPLRIIASLPQDRMGRQEPLLSTGHTGRADFVFIRYVDGRHIRLGYDHWAIGGGMSDPVEVDYGVPHDFTVSLGSLYPEESDPSWASAGPSERRRLKSEVSVRLDGREVYRAKLDAYPAAPGEIAPLLNAIGGSSCDSAFTGDVYSVGRLDRVAP